MSRATVSAMMFAITPPEVSTAQEPSPNPISARNQRRDLLLDERADGSRDPDVDALVHPLREELARDRHRERRGGEVAVRPGVLRIEDVGRDALAELTKHVGGAGGAVRRPGGLARRTEERAAHLGVRQRSERPLHRVLVEIPERFVPDRSSEPFERRTGHGLVADVDELGFGVVGEGVRHGGEASTWRLGTLTPATRSGPRHPPRSPPPRRSGPGRGALGTARTPRWSRSPRTATRGPRRRRSRIARRS